MYMLEKEELKVEINSQDILENTFEDFVKKEMKEISKHHSDENFDADQVFEYYLLCDLNINDLKAVKDLKVRSLVYEFLCLFPKEFSKLNLFNEMLKIVENIHDKKEKNYLVEKKNILKIKNIQKTVQEIFNENSFNNIESKVSYIIVRRLFFMHSPDNEYENTNRVELFNLLDQISTDIMLYFNTLKILSKENADDLNENYLKSYILRILKAYSNRTFKIEFKLINTENKSTYFIENKSEVKFFMHFYARVFLYNPKFIQFKNLGLNGGFHYLLKRKIIEPNSYNDLVRIKEDIWKFVDMQNTTDFYIDNDMIESQKDDVISQLKKDEIINKEWGDLLLEIKDVDNKELNDLLFLEKYKTKLKKTYYNKKIDNQDQLKKVKEKIEKIEKGSNNLITKDKKLEKLKNKEKFLGKLINDGKLHWNPEIRNAWLQRNFSYAFTIKIYLSFIEFFKDYNDPLYFATYFDFRGRYYYNSIVAPNAGWPFRFMYNFGDIKIEEEKKVPYILKNEDYIELLQKLEKKIGPLNDRQKNSALWVFLSIGAITISKKKKITDKEFINEGWSNYENRKRADDLLETSELKYYYLILDQLKEEKVNRYVIKDVSGSIFQNAALILGTKNNSALTSLNIDGEDYSDPYFELIENIQKNVDDDLKLIFTRKTLKKAIMTRYYNSTLITSFKYFMKEVKGLEIFEEIKKKKNIFNQIFENFKRVYNSLQNLEKEIYYQYSTKEYNNFLKEKKIFDIDYEDFIFNTICYKLIPSRIDITVDGKRITCTNLRQSNEILKLKMNNSMMPNIFHAEDSYRARNLIKKYGKKCFSIHDAFAVSYLNIEKFTIDANKSFDINKKRNFYIGKNNIEKEMFSKYKTL